MRAALILYLTLLATGLAGGIFVAVRAGHSLAAAVVSAYLIFVFVNGSLGYMLRARQLKAEGKAPPPYLQYLVFPQGIPEPNEEAPNLLKTIVGIVALIAGVLLVLCGAALALDAEFSSILHPMIAVTVCLVVAGIGAAFLYIAWRLLVTNKRPPRDAA